MTETQLTPEELHKQLTPEELIELGAEQGAEREREFNRRLDRARKAEQARRGAIIIGVSFALYLLTGMIFGFPDNGLSGAHPLMMAAVAGMAYGLWQYIQGENG